MMMTEEEASTKWCPETRYLATFRNDAGKLETAGCFNRGGADSGLEKARCIGSECMAWRWGEEQKFEIGTPLPVGSKPANPEWETHGAPYLIENRSRVQAWRRPIAGRKGFCGKACKPCLT